MKTTLGITASAIALTLAMGSGPAFAKAHDQGVADGDFPAISTGDVVKSLGGMGVSSVVGDGARGDAASANGGDNRVIPVERPGQINQPD
ncbi:hypothetical protein [Leisingera caerulea]|uniref:Uncharacterized protein n=1 Tax=Leisingera caerulea TaxID=506591 RepID=A0A9Q9LYF2_LEICA|nr:hypothetical protein [Leisingera caerulea]UWQ55955.1 hypothetical protein K3721_19165 [Leisingera caerulea]